MEVLEVYLHGDRFRLVLVVELSLARSRTLLLIAFRGKRRGKCLVQDHDVQAAADGIIEVRHLNAADGRADVGAGGEVQVFTAPVKRWKTGIAHTISDLPRILLGERVEEDRVEVVLEVLRVCQPLAVRRPRKIDVTRVVGLGIDERVFAGRQVQKPKVAAHVAVSDLLAIGGPGGTVVVRRSLAKGELLRLTLSTL